MEPYCIDLTLSLDLVTNWIGQVLREYFHWRTQTGKMEKARGGNDAN